MIIIILIIILIIIMSFSFLNDQLGMTKSSVRSSPLRVSVDP